MMQESEKISALKSVEWWDSELLVGAANDWFLDWRSELLRFRVSQWEFALRVGATAGTFQEFENAWAEFLEGRIGADGKRSGGAVDRDSGQRTWGRPELAQDLWMKMSGASRPQVSRRSESLESEARKLGPQAWRDLDDWRRLHQARLFLSFLVMRIRAEFGSKD